MLNLLHPTPAPMPPVPQPPAYESTPSYAVLPRVDEQTLARSAGSRLPAFFSRTVLKRTKDVSLSLNEQPAGLEAPVFDRGGNASGVVTIASTEGVRSVDIRFEGHLRAECFGEGTLSKLLLSQTLSLWREIPDGPECPTELPFRLRLPRTFRDPETGKVQFLPPSYHAELEGAYGFQARVTYRIYVRAAVVGAARRDKTLATPFTMAVRTRAPTRAHEAPESVMNVLKTAPDGWGQCDLRAHTDGPEEVLVQLFLPSPRIYAIQDSIPILVQVVGSPASLSDFAADARHPASIRVQLVRRVSVTINNQIFTKSEVSGRGTLRRILQGADHVAWEGEVVTSANVGVSSFYVDGLSVTDWILISLVPHKKAPLAFIEQQRLVQVSLATDRWEDMGEARHL